MTSNELFIILGNHLFPYQCLKESGAKDSTIFFMAEDNDLCTHFKYHKHKIIFFLASMREYHEELAKKHKTYYCKLNEKEKHLTYIDKIEECLKKNNKIKIIKIYEIEDKFFESYLTKYFDSLSERGIKYEIIQSPSFLTTRSRFSEYLNSVKKPFMANFYQRQRKRLNILIDDDKKPIGGKWSYDSDNRKKMPKGTTVPPTLLKKQQSQHLKEVITLTNKLFSDHPGSSKDYWIPTNRKEALKYLNIFLKQKIHNFGSYQDAIVENETFLFHSVISPMVNIGFLPPKEVIAKTLETYKKNAIPLNSIEGFIRQIIGWREFVRGIYQNYSEEQDRSNFFNHKRKLSHHWYDGTTGIPPVDDAILRVRKYSYTHHIDRLMVISNFMLLCEIEPREVHKWFMEMFSDSSDWVMGPNVYGMGQFSDGGIFATKPYISGSNYIIKMSNFIKGEWCDVWDGLYWSFIDKNREFYQSNPRMGFVINTIDKMGNERKERIFSAAKHFLNRIDA